jgi:cardiolipin synthase
MGYFVPVGRVLKELLRARRRGVFVQVVVPGQSDVPLAQRATRHLYSRLVRRHFHIYERQKNMLHSKVLVADDQWTTIGSANLEARGLWINLELMAVIHSRPLAEVINRIIDEELQYSERVRLRTWRARSRWQRLLDRLAWSLRWWL